MRISDWSSDVCSPICSPRPRELVGRKTRLPRRRRPRTTTKNAPASRGVCVHRTGRQGRAASVLFLFGLDFLLGLDRLPGGRCRIVAGIHGGGGLAFGGLRSEEPTSELQSLMRISYAVFCLKKKKSTN